MLMAYKVKPEKRSVIPAPTHVDGTGRLQTVSKDDNPRYRKLIKEFEKSYRGPGPPQHVFQRKRARGLHAGRSDQLLQANENGCAGDWQFFSRKAAELERCEANTLSQKFVEKNSNGVDLYAR